MKKYAEFLPAKAEAPPFRAADGLVIRPAGRADLSQLAVLAAEREDEPEADWVGRFERILAATRSGESILLVAALGDTIAGYGRCAYFTPPADSPANVAPAGFYLTGMIVGPGYRRRGLGSALTRARMAWIRERSPRAYYFANERNRVSIELHRALGFSELTRDFSHPHVQFEGGAGILFACDLGGDS
jgi:ribosomal protein S18 acetylase RimI-like enzyme